MQTHCNQEGFNSIGKDKGRARARIGIVGNQEMTATAVTRGSGLEPEEQMTTQTLVETMLPTHQIMETSISKLGDTY